MDEPGLYEVRRAQQVNVIRRIDNLPMPVGYVEAFVIKLNSMGYTIARKVEKD